MSDFDEIREHARELAPETESFEQFAAMLGLGSSCERCGREGLDDDEYTDCDLVPGEQGTGPDVLVCAECLHGDKA